MDIKQVIELLERFRSGTCTDQEKAILESWYLHYAKNSKDVFSNDRLEQILKEIEVDLPPNQLYHEQSIFLIHPFFTIKRIIAAAIILIVFSTGLYLYRSTEQQNEVLVEHKVDILPGGNKAILILADGSKIDLKGAENGLLATEGAIEIRKTSDGTLAYQSSLSLTKIFQHNNLMNTIIIPKGGTYKITLPDGSDVWLNSESSLSYPVAFIGDERKVELSGEAYFEITRDEQKPFRVHSNNQVVEVLGTQFNINTYEESGFIETTLVEGSVRVTQNYSNGKPYKTRLLKPGQQSLTNLFKPEIKIENVDIEKEIAWKNGFFKFKNTNIQNIMREIERWYDVKVQYEGKIPSEEFTGIISRDVEITKMLKILEQGGGVQFSVSGKRILVKSD